MADIRRYQYRLRSNIVSHAYCVAQAMEMGSKPDSLRRLCRSDSARLDDTPHAYLDQSAIQAGGCILGLFGGWAMGTIVKKNAAARREAARKLALAKFGNSGTIKEFPVKSRMIEAIYFCQENGQLRIRLNNGQDRLFDGVSETDALAISSARSPGDYYLKKFKGRYKRAA